MRRRSFIKNTAASAAILSTSACQPQVAPEKQETFLDDNFPLKETSIKQLSDAYAKGTMSIEQVVQQYLDRIKLIDKEGPALNSIIEVNPDALAEARASDQELKNGSSRGPLHGIPIMLKDNIDTAGKMMTTAGSWALEGNYPEKHSWVAQKLVDAGAILIAKTNLSEWANFRSYKSSSGWSGRGGQTKNPYITDRNPCGSSSGSGVAVSANLCAAAIGTETNGSVVCPSSINGIVGIKPTIGLVSRAGIVPIAHSHDTAGPMARSVEDAALILGTMTGQDPLDDYTERSVGKSKVDYTSFLDPNSLKGKRLGRATQFNQFHPEVNKLVDQAIRVMEDLGATVVEMDKDDLNGNSGDDAFQVLLYEFKHDLNKYFEGCTSDIPVRSMEELREFNEKNADREMPYFGQELVIEAQAKGDLNSEEYKKALEHVLRANGPEGIDRVMEKYELDAIIAPTTGPSWPTDWVNGDNYPGGSSSPAARSGYPNITVPMGFVHGLPVGISIFAEAFSEPKLISLAYAYEQATKHRAAPEFLSTFKG